ncbi:MAG TPA: hypothetical protein VKZ63_13090, partial [Kofleriaceae bacterium]|nr:hypothetical protein [Kofleriaceae bacterium]
RPRDTREQTLLTILSCPDGHDGDGGVLRVSDVSWTRRRRRLALRQVADLEIDGAAAAAIAGALEREGA